MALRYGLTQYAAPATELWTDNTEAKAHLRIDSGITAHDAWITNAVKSARQYIERYTGRALVTQTWDLFLDCWPGNELWLPFAPLQSVSYVKYCDSDGTQQTWTSSNYVVSTSRDPGVIRLAYGATWPVHRGQPDAINVRFVAGYGTLGYVPEAIKQAALLLIGHWFANREGVVVGAGSQSLEWSVQSLLDSYRLGDEFTCYGREG